MHQVITRPAPSKQCSPDGRTPSTRARSRATAGFSATISCTGRAYDVCLSVTGGTRSPTHGTRHMCAAPPRPAVRLAPCAAVARVIAALRKRAEGPCDRPAIAADPSLHCARGGVSEEVVMKGSSGAWTWVVAGVALVAALAVTVFG